MRVAIVGGGIAGLAAALEFEQARLAGAPVDWQLFEASDRFGGILHTTRRTTPTGEWVLEGGPDGWVAEKPWARELAAELGLGAEVIACYEDSRKTYLWQHGELVPMPARMRLMVPEDLRTLHSSPLFSSEAIAAYAQERERAAELRAAAPRTDESVASFVRRHFGEEVLGKIAAPLLSGVFGGDVERLSVRAVMPAFVRMEAETGSLVLTLEQRRPSAAGTGRRPTFESLRNGMASLTGALLAHLPPKRRHTGVTVTGMTATAATGWTVHLLAAGKGQREDFEHILLALPVGAARHLLQPLDPGTTTLLPAEASSAVLVGLGWDLAAAAGWTVPPGFGFLVPAGQPADAPQMLAATFMDQKFPHRAPAGGRLIRVFFGEGWAQRMAGWDDRAIAGCALTELRKVLGPIPEPDSGFTTVRHWPHSLPQYAVGHLERMAELGSRIARLPGLHLLGNGVHGVGVPDLIREARAAARRIHTG